MSRSGRVAIAEEVKWFQDLMVFAADGTVMIAVSGGRVRRVDLLQWSSMNVEMRSRSVWPSSSVVSESGPAAAFSMSLMSW